MIPIFDTESASASVDIPLVSLADDLRESVVGQIQTNPLHAIARTHLMEVVDSLRPEWWERREQAAPHEVISEIYRYSRDRIERRTRVLERAAAPPAALPADTAQVSPRTPRVDLHAPEIGTPPPVTRPALSVAVSPPIDAVLDRMALYIAHPDQRPSLVFPEVHVKRWDQLSPRSQQDYRRGMKQVLSELRAGGYSSVWDMAAYLVHTAQTSSLSTYKRRRNVIIRLLYERHPRALLMIQALPPYGEMCRLLGRSPSRDVTDITRARRAQQSPQTWGRLLSRLSPEHKDNILTLRYTGARVCEGSSLRLQADEHGIRVTVTSSKTGARRRRGSPVRSWIVPLDSVEGTVLAGVLARRGEHPITHTPDAIRGAWRRARKGLGLNTDSGWDLHSLRHQYARDYKRKTARAMQDAHGPDWRRRLYGRHWQDSTEYMTMYYGELARRLGHTDISMSKIYG